MQTITKVALDAMGGDNAPAEIVKGAVDAVSSREDIKVFLVGQEDVVRVYPVISVIWKLLIMKEIHAPLMPVRYLLTVWQNTSVHMLQQ